MYLESKISTLEQKLSFLNGQKMELINQQEVPADDADIMDEERNLLQWKYKEKMNLLKDKQDFFQRELRDYRKELLDLHHAFIPENSTRYVDDGWRQKRRRF